MVLHAPNQNIAGLDIPGLLGPRSVATLSPCFRRAATSVFHLPSLEPEMEIRKTARANARTAVT
jgi:hypothetical protein